jgi:hypothetical protein
MANDGAVITPDRARRAAYERDYRIFLAMHEQRRALDAIAYDRESDRPRQARAAPDAGRDRGRRLAGGRLPW